MHQPPRKPVPPVTNTDPSDPAIGRLYRSQGATNSSIIRAGCRTTKAANDRRKQMTRTLRELRAQLTTLLLMVGVAVLGLAVGAYLVVHQRIEWPSWVPLLGRHEFVLSARVSGVSGVLPGQGQAVSVSGVTVGQISGVSLRHGVPVVRMSIDPRYAGRIYSNATVLLRPKTGLNDMVAELDPGSAAGGRRLRSGAVLSSGSTLPTVGLDEVLSQLDTDTRAELELLVNGAGQALADGGGVRLGDVFRRFDPLSRDVARASRLVALRGVELRRLMGNLSRVAGELGDNESALSAFVEGNEGAFRAFARQDQNLQQTIRLLPPALSATNTALGHATSLGRALRGTLGPLDPSARGLGPTLADLRPFFNATTPVLRDQLRPFSVKAKPTARALAPATRELAKATPGLTTLAGELDNIVNELAFKPKHQQSYLFYIPWASHNTNSALSNQDGTGPIRNSLLLFPCGSLQLANGTYLQNPNQNPTLYTLLSLLDLPSFSQHCNGDLPK
jgi:phospholipid/cholesterol/gamma-HCH transport system substrate-binding protein